MCNDKISRQALLDEINEEIEYGEEHFCSENELINKGLKIARKLVRALPAIEAEPVNDNWISVKDRMPEDGKYLVYAKNIAGYRPLDNPVFVAECYHGIWVFEGWENNHITHWQPLPEPPKEV